MPKKFLGILVILAVLVLGAEIVYVSKQNQKPQVELEETRPYIQFKFRHDGQMIPKFMPEIGNVP